MGTHSTTAVIDLDALAFNLHHIRAVTGMDKKVLAVVKANAYGHGMAPVARELDSLGVDFLGVAFLEEAIQLRDLGIEKPILILGGILPEQAPAVPAHNLTPAVYDVNALYALEAAGKEQRRVVSVHLKINTGMNRLGVGTEDLAAFLERLKSCRHVQLEGVLSHFSSAHLQDEESEEFTRKQGDDFLAALRMVRQITGGRALAHMSSSASIVKGLLPGLDMVRVGLLLYGAHPAPGSGQPVPVRPVMSVRTKILQVARLAVSSPIGYGRTFRTRRASVIATIGVGYGDGFCHALSNRGCVLIHGKRAPVVGSVCMDLTMADVTDIAGVQAGEEAVLLGTQGNEHLPAEEVAAQAGTIAYEVLCRVSARVPRMYRKKNGELGNVETGIR